MQVTCPQCRALADRTYDPPLFRRTKCPHCGYDLEEVNIKEGAKIADILEKERERELDAQIERDVEFLRQKYSEYQEKWLEDNDPKYGTTGREISSNLTDNESAKMKTSHGVIQGYNSQAFIDAKHQVIIHAEAFGRGQDHAHGPPMLDGALENLQSLGHGEEYLAGKIFTADTNYHSDTNLRKCQELRLDAYIRRSALNAAPWLMDHYPGMRKRIALAGSACR